MPSFECARCGKSFRVPDEVIAKYPGWVPRTCRTCKGGASSSSAVAVRRSPVRAGPVERDLTLAQVLEKYTDGPTEGVFTDGASHPNPGAGGWGAVYVVGGEIVAAESGHDPATTNNRMELTALLRGAELVPAGVRASVWTDSQLCVNTINSWAATWERHGWKRKGGPIKNLDLVQSAYAVFRARPELELKWIKAHNGNRWNEYADALATAYRRDVR